MGNEMIERTDSKKAIIFCQSPAEMANSLSQYEKCLNDRYDIYIICLGVRKIHKFLVSLSLNANVLYFDDLLIPWYNPVKWFINRKIIKDNLLKVTMKNSDGIIAFFSSRIDITLGIYLKYFLKYTVYYVKNGDSFTIDDKLAGVNRIDRRIKAIIMSFIVGFKCRSSYADGYYCSILDIKPYKTIIEIPFINDESIYNRFAYKNVDLGKSNKKVIFFTEPYRNKYQTKENYDIMNINIVNELKKRGWFVCMKGHPRIGSHPLLKNIVDLEIPDFIPSQFLDLTEFNFAIGFTSSSLCGNTRHSYSVLEMCDIIDANNKNFLKKILEGLAPNKIKYIRSFDEII
jgi:hypothetical protein